MKKIRVLQLIGSAKPGGAETFALRLFIALSKRKEIQLKVVARKDSWIAAQLKKAKVDVEEAAFGGVFDFICGRTGAAVKRITEEFHPHIVQSWMNRATRFVPKGKWARIARLGGFYNLKYYRGQVTELITNTEQIRAYCIENGWPENAVGTLPNFAPKPSAGWQKKGTEVRKKFRIPAKVPVLMVAGRLHPVKGIDVALRALTRLPNNVHLVLAGEGGEREELAALAEELKVRSRVHFAGWVDDLSPFAAAADVWLAPSRHEPLGNTVLDAWAHAKPVVASEVGGMAVLIESGSNGLLVAPEDDVALANAIGKLLKSKTLAQKLANGGAARLAKIYGEEMVVRAYVDYYARQSGAR